MWKLRVSQGDDPWIKSTNNHIGRQYWEFDPNHGTLEEKAEVEKARDEFHKNRFQVKHSSDLLVRLQVLVFIYLQLMSFLKIINPTSTHCIKTQGCMILVYILHVWSYTCI